MFPTLSFWGQRVTTYGLCVGIGLAALLFGTILNLQRHRLLAREAYYVLPKLVVALLFAFAGAIVMDALLKMGVNGGFKLSGMTFYGGLITGVAALAVQLALFRKSSLTVMQWLDFLTVPFLLFHFCGRMGCFFGGCCYGVPTTSPLGVVFPDQPEAGIVHGGVAVYPTQLFEAGGLLVLAVVLGLLPRGKFLGYCYGYPVLRSIVEIWRGDERGSFIGALSPAQFTSVMILAITTLAIGSYFLHRKCGIPNAWKCKNGGKPS